MKVTLLVVGKTDEPFLREGISFYIKRLRRYADFKMEIIPDVKKSRRYSTEKQKIAEGEKIISGNHSGKELHLFDERGDSYSSREFAEFLEKKMVSGLKELVFVIGGPFGFSDEVCEKANSKISLSKMTFSHQLARLLCIEQIYRAFTIIKGEPYHND
jgi:23S rRNA (pseudouridine1915-N3)-methyltransferase